MFSFSVQFLIIKVYLQCLACTICLPHTLVFPVFLPTLCLLQKNLFFIAIDYL